VSADAAGDIQLTMQHKRWGEVWAVCERRPICRGIVVYRLKGVMAMANRGTSINTLGSKTLSSSFISKQKVCRARN